MNAMLLEARNHTTFISFQAMLAHTLERWRQAVDTC